MAKLNGWELKGIVRFKGHEGESLLQGNLYKDGKKVGFYSDGDWGGECTINLSVKNNPKEMQWLIWELLELRELEKGFKRALKKGHDFIATWNLEQSEVEVVTGVYSKHIEQVTAMAKKDKALDSFKAFKGINDFIVECKIKNPLINEVCNA